MYFIENNTKMLVGIAFYHLFLIEVIDSDCNDFNKIGTNASNWKGRNGNPAGHQGNFSFKVPESTGNTGWIVKVTFNKSVISIGYDGGRISESSL